MSVGNYQSFNLDLTDTGCVEEVIDAIVQRKIEKYQDELHDLQIANSGLISDYLDMECRIRELEDELVKERQGKYEN